MKNRIAFHLARGVNYMHFQIKLINELDKQQDLKMEQKDGEPQAGYCLISLAEVMKKLTECEMVCYYCQCKVFIRYKAVKEPTQWTLDRKDNDYGHTNDNTLIACLKCNLARRVMPLAKFTFTKHLKITKKGE